MWIFGFIYIEIQLRKKKKKKLFTFLFLIYCEFNLFTRESLKYILYKNYEKNITISFDLRKSFVL